uniref:uncharacterized protein n=1 Tax=Semicossyphus pulcher TaxID=241346 RepID=UPI0037E8FC86
MIMDIVKSFMDKFGPNTPEVVAADSSVVTRREINAKAKSLNMAIKTETDPGSQHGKAVGPVAPGNYTAQHGSVICTDKIEGSFDGDIDLSVSVKSKVRAGKVDETPPSSSQGPAVKLITEHKVELIDCLRADHSFILQHVHAKHILTDRQYQNIKHISQPERSVTDLIDQVMGKGQESCCLFLKVLREPDVLGTYPQLKDITNKMC